MYMIPKISLTSSIYKGIQPAFKQQPVQTLATDPEIMIEITHPDDVKNNFTMEKITKGVLSQHAINKTHIKGKSYGIDYDIYRNASMGNMDLKGTIGGKPLEINKYRNNFFSLKSHIEGYVGDKEVKLTESYGLSSTKLKGKFGDEEIDIKIYPFRYDDMYVGKGIDMYLRYYLDNPINKISSPKYTGRYELDPEFLPILAALYRAM